MPSREWTAANSGLSRASQLPPVVAPIFTIMLRCRQDIIGSDGLFAIHKLDSPPTADNGYFSIEINTSFSPEPPAPAIGIRAKTQVWTAGRSGPVSTTGTATSLGLEFFSSKWMACFASFAATNAREAAIAYCGDVSSASGGNDSTTVTSPPDVNSSDCNQVVGRKPGNPTTAAFDGHIQDVGIWDTLLQNSDWHDFISGANPTDIRPDKLIAYMPIDDDPANPGRMYGRDGNIWLLTSTSTTGRAEGVTSSRVNNGNFWA